MYHNLSHLIHWMFPILPIYFVIKLSILRSVLYNSRCYIHLRWSCNAMRKLWHSMIWIVWPWLRKSYPRWLVTQRFKLSIFGEKKVNLDWVHTKWWCCWLHHLPPRVCPDWLHLFDFSLLCVFSLIWLVSLSLPSSQGLSRLVAFVWLLPTLCLFNDLIGLHYLPPRVCPNWLHLFDF